MHTVDYHLGLLEPLGIASASQALSLRLPAAAHAEGAKASSRAPAITGDSCSCIRARRGRRNSGKPDRWASVIEFAAQQRTRLRAHRRHIRARANHIAQIKRARARAIYRSLRQDRSAHARGLDREGAAARHGRFRADASRCRDADAAGRAVRSDESVALAAALHAGGHLAGRTAGAGTEFSPKQRPVADEPHLDGAGDRCYGSAAAAPRGAICMSGPQEPESEALVLGDDQGWLGPVSAAVRVREPVQGPLRDRARASALLYG